MLEFNFANEEKGFFSREFNFSDEMTNSRNFFPAKFSDNTVGFIVFACNAKSLAIASLFLFSTLFWD